MTDARVLWRILHCLSEGSRGRRAAARARGMEMSDVRVLSNLEDTSLPEPRIKRYCIIMAMVGNCFDSV